MAKISKIITHSILVKGRVQGVGFRPFIYLQAKKLNLCGQVKNTSRGVLIVSQGNNTKKLISILRYTPPPLSQIAGITIKQYLAAPLTEFTIKKSLENERQSGLVQIIPDLAICGDCVIDIENPRTRRFFYPFTNCTQCGPRYSIIYSLPYDRPKTTMRTFKMCKNCANEYKDPTDRRFHAQPNACPVCGPQITLTNTRGKPTSSQRQNSQVLISQAQNLLIQGKILAIRSIGGFLLACDAKNDQVVRKLRARKNRPAKPFAIMCKDIATIKRICHIRDKEITLLKSQIAPIVLLKKKGQNNAISKYVAPNNGYLGVMLPYAPLHKLLFTPPLDSIAQNQQPKNVSRETFHKGKSNLDTLIMTSANPQNAPIIADSGEITTKLNGVFDYILDHNRPIESRCDDSVIFNYKGPVIVRYSRGYVPEPIYLQNISIKPVLAFGSDLKNCFALGQGNKIYLSPHIGDLASQDSINFLFEMLEKYQKWFGIKPEIAACDLHPDYISRRLAEKYARTHKIPLMLIQHHYAHLAGAMAEHDLTNPIIGVGYDGAGYGTDGNIWGSEITVLDYTNFVRISHLKYMPLIGGDVAITNPRLLAKTYLRKSNADGGLLTSSMGRLFDAVSSILDLCHKQTFEGEAPIALEAEAMKTKQTGWVQKLQSVNFKTNELIDQKAILEEVLKMKRQGFANPEIAWYFHNRIIQITVEMCQKIRTETKIKTVCLSGGVFQNRIILNGVYSNLGHAGFKVFINRLVPINDGGIAFGQAIIAGLSKNRKANTRKKINH